TVSESDESNDSQDINIVDEDILINEVDVDMQEFYQNINKDVEWVGHDKGNLEVPIQMDVEEGCDLDNFDMDIDCDSDIETSRKRKTGPRALRRESKTKVAAFLLKNDKVRVMAICRGKFHVFNNLVRSNASGLNSPSKSNLKQMNEKWVKAKRDETTSSGKGINKMGGMRIKVVKTYNDEHTYLQIREVKVLTYKWLANKIEEIVKPNLNILVKALKEKLHKKYQVGINIGKVKREKAKSIMKVKGDFRDDLDLNPMSNFTFISDRQKGIIPAIAQVFPCAAHRFCLRHIYKNMKAQWRGFTTP
nr:hypothetical protein [Tanacetum cinerariifolium]